MEGDDEVHNSEGSSYDFGARQYDSRIGRWLSIDALAKLHPNESNYVYVRNNPIIFIDPDGNTDFYFNGKFVGDDGVDNGLIGIVKSKSIAKQIKKNQYNFESKIKVGINTDFVVINFDILKATDDILGLALDKGKIKEFGAIFEENTEGEFVMAAEGIQEGPELDLDKKGSGSVDLDKSVKDGVSIHSHRTGMGKETGMTASPDEPSGADKYNMNIDLMSIIVGKKGVAIIETGSLKYKDNRNKGGYVEFFNEENKDASFLSLSGYNLDKMIKHQNKKRTK